MDRPARFLGVLGWKGVGQEPGREPLLDFSFFIGTSDLY